MKRFAILSVLFALVLAACQPTATQPIEPAPPATAAPATAAPATAVPAAEEPTADIATAVPADESAPSTEDRIANATSAAPTVIGKDATILDWPTEEGGP